MAEPSPFDDAAIYYDRFRAPYAPAALRYMGDTLGLGRDARILDLGCGPGTVAIPLSRRVAEVVAVDPGAAMLSQARRLAALRGVTNIRWIQGRAEDLPSDLGTFQLVTMGQSFHWMDRDRVLRQLADLVEPGGALAILDEGRRRPQESWEPLAAAVAGRFLTRRGRHPLKHPEVAHAPSLRRSSHFADFTVREFAFEISRDTASILGCVYAGVGLSKSALGERAAAFETELVEALLRLNPSGLFHEQLETAVLIAPRRSPGLVTPAEQT